MMHYRDHTAHNNIRLIRMPFGGPSVRAVVVTRGAFGGVGFLLYFYTMSVLPLADAMTLLSLRTIITVWMAALVLKEPVRLSQVAAAVGGLVGCILIAQPSFLFRRQSSSSTYSYVGYITGLLGACLSTAVFILLRLAGQEVVHTLQLLFSWVFFGTLYSLLVGVLQPALSLGGHSFVWRTSTTAWLYVLGACVFGSMAHELCSATCPGRSLFNSSIEWYPVVIRIGSHNLSSSTCEMDSGWSKSYCFIVGNDCTGKAPRKRWYRISFC